MLLSSSNDVLSDSSISDIEGPVVIADMLPVQAVIQSEKSLDVSCQVVAKG